MQSLMLRAAVAFSAAALCAAAHAGSVPTYHVVDLGAGYAPAAINASGVIVGTYAFQFGPASPVRYADGAWTTLASPPGFPATPSHINDAGAIVGYGINGAMYVAVAWTAAGAPAVIAGDQPGGYTHAAGIDDVGDAAVDVWSTGKHLVADTWSSTTWALTPLVPPLGGSELILDAMNGKGRMAGHVLDADQAWQMVSGKATGWKTIGTLTPGGSTYAGAMNDAGHIACTDYTAASVSRACWYDGKKLHDLTPSTMAQALAKGINASDLIVGEGVDAKWIHYAMLWMDGQPHQLLSRLRDTTDWSALQDAVAINDAGQIIGTGTFRDGTVHGYLLNPVK